MNNRIKRGKMAVLFKFLRTNAWILGITILCMVLFFSFIDLYAILSRTNAHRDNQWLEILIIIILLLIPVAFIYAIFHVIHMTLTGASRNLQMGSVLLSYIAVIFVFRVFIISSQQYRICMMPKKSIVTTRIFALRPWQVLSIPMANCCIERSLVDLSMDCLQRYGTGCARRWPDGQMKQDCRR